MSGILGQSAPTAATWTDLYTCPANTIASMRVIISNRSASATSFRVAVSPNGEAIADKHWIAPGKPIAGNDTGATIAFIISSGDIVRVYATTADLSFTATGETRAE